MKIKAILSTVSVSILLLTALVWPAVASAAPSVPTTAISSGSIEKYPATTEIKPSLSADGKNINVAVKYKAEELAWTIGGQRTRIFPKKISAVEVYVNGTERDTQLFAPSASGVRHFTLPVSSFTPAERANTMRFQAKASTHFVYAPLHIDSSAWNIRTVSSKVVTFKLP